ncbi:hypothetical protein TNCV_789591 [Trichonephila clavipes]|nr:hypothetical protein TNCV_789591 [Trichonephila clavipes]
MFHARLHNFEPRSSDEDKLAPPPKKLRHLARRGALSSTGDPSTRWVFSGTRARTHMRCRPRIRVDYNHWAKMATKIQIQSDLYITKSLNPGKKLIIRIRGHETTPLRVKEDSKDVSSELDNGGYRLHFLDETSRFLLLSARPGFESRRHGCLWKALDPPSRGVLPLNLGVTELNRTVTCMALKATANDRRISSLCHDEFRGPLSDYVRQVALATTT